MSEAEKTTLERIHEVAKTEFREKGFKSASLRNIVKVAGVTTGAFYGYYKSKEELFDALVGKQYDVFMNIYRDTQLSFARQSPEEQRNSMDEISGDCMEWMLEYAYKHKDVFKLLVCSAEGTKYESMIHDMVEIETEATHAFADAIKHTDGPVYTMEPELEHVLISGMFTAFFEMIIHDVPYEKASKYLHELRVFYTAGWQKIMGF